MLARARSLVAVLGATVVVGALLTLPSSAGASVPTDPAGGPVEVAGDAAARAVAVLDEADDIVSGTPSGRDLSMVLLDLARTRADLPAARRAEAREILARPTDGIADPLGFGYRPGANPTQACQGGFCVHWARATSDAPDLTDGNGNGRPDSVDRVFTTLATVGGTYARAGYKTPVRDGLLGGGGPDLFDVYLVDSGAQGVYGYCALEGTNINQNTPAYCAIDNDFAEFRANTPVENMQVTVAHEYFHAVQYAYDITEDAWFLESTAAWVEDEMYDDVDDNRQYLQASPMAQPAIPIDQARGIRRYGSWIFFRYLSELEPRAQAGLPTIVRDLWREAATGSSYSIKAIEAVLADRGRSLTTTLARFADANRHPGRSYAEGSHYRATRPKTTRTVAARRSAQGRLAVDHLASDTLRYRPGAGTAARSWKLRVAVDLPARSRPTAAIVTARKSSGGFVTKLVKVDRAGAGSVRLPFSKAKVRYVDVTLVNAGIRYDCQRDSLLSCQGKSLDDDLVLRVQVRALR